jgi:hypothetical protein
MTPNLSANAEGGLRCRWPGKYRPLRSGEHITMPVAILSDDDDLVCDRVDYVPVFGLLLPDRTRTAWGLRLLGTKSSQTLC